MLTLRYERRDVIWYTKENCGIRSGVKAKKSRWRKKASRGQLWSEFEEATSVCEKQTLSALLSKKTYLEAGMFLIDIFS